MRDNVDVSIGYFDGQACEVERNGDKIEIFYGGLGYPIGDGHGHVVSNDGINIHYWRLPKSEGGTEIIDDSSSFENLMQHCS